MNSSWIPEAAQEKYYTELAKTDVKFVLVEPVVFSE